METRTVYDRRNGQELGVFVGDDHAAKMSVLQWINSDEGAQWAACYVQHEDDIKYADMLTLNLGQPAIGPWIGN